MWFDFLLTTVFIVLALYLPTCLIARAFNQSWLRSFVCAPIFSIFGYCLLGICYAKIGFIATPLSMILPLLVVEALVFCIVGELRKKSTQQVFLHPSQDTKQEWMLWGCYAGVAALVVLYYYVGTLDGAASFPQDSDNTWHLALIQSFVQSGDLSILDSTLYHDFRQFDIAPIVPIGGGFYPAAWHVLAALCVQQFGVPVSLAANSVNLVFLVLVFPSCMWYFFRMLFPKKATIIALGSILCLGFVAYPWGMLISVSGPLYPNFAGYAFVPLVCALFMGLFSRGGKDGKFAKIVMILIGVVTMAMLHVNAVFATVVILVPYCVYRITKRIHGMSFDKKRKLVFSVAASILFLLVVLGVWAILFNTPALHTTVSYLWAPYADKHQEFINILLLAYKIPGTQIVLAIAVLVGVVYTFYNRKYLWLSFSYLIACWFCFLSATGNSFLKSFFTGFWYTDVYRLGAMAALVAIPLAALGLYVMIELIKRVSRQILSEKKQRSFVRVSGIAFILCFVAANYYPSFSVPGIGYVETGFGYYQRCNIVANAIDRPNLYDEDEKEFVQKVSEIVDPSYVIYNNADDGSPFAYAFNGLNLAYRRSAAQLLDGGETAQSKLLRNNLNELSTNKEVQEALKSANVRYILVLDLGGEATDERCYYGYYSPSKWKGPNAINDDTPGLKTLLSEGDMRLYEIDYEAQE